MACRFLKAPQSTQRGLQPRRLEGPVVQKTEEPQEEANFALDHEIKGERTHKQHRAPTRLPWSGYVLWCVSVAGLVSRCAVSLVTSVVGL